MTTTLWHSRLPDRATDPAFEAMNASIGVDVRLFREEIAATKAHACALRRAGVYTNEECGKVRSALCRIEEDIAGGKIPLQDFEDIHTLVETQLIELTGDAGAKIQTSRSRNEQTQVAQRLFMKTALNDIVAGIHGLQEASVKKAEQNMDAVMPGYTHARPAQPIRFAHYLCALFTGLERDKGRLLDALGRMDASPSGSGALAGATFPLDRDAMARDLGFKGPTDNSLDTVSDRDAQLETLSALAIIMVRLSRLAEDLILWSSPAYGFVDLDDAYCTSSSLMPQKKNPDALELVRGKTGRVAGDLLNLLVTCKGLPTGYQKDLQEDKEPLFDASDTVLASLEVTAGVVASLTVDEVRMKEAVTPECLASDQADLLVLKGVPFRKAFSIVAETFREPDNGKRKRGNNKKDASPECTPESSVEKRDLPGGTSSRAVREQLRRARSTLGA